MSANAEYDRRRVDAAQGTTVTLQDGREGTVANSYVLGDNHTLYVRVPTTCGTSHTYFWMSA